MIVDTSALIAVLYEEDHAAELRRALLSEAGAIPAPAALEFVRVADRQSPELGAIARDLLTELTANGIAIVPFEGTTSGLRPRLTRTTARAWGKGASSTCST